MCHGITMRIYHRQSHYIILHPDRYLCVLFLPCYLWILMLTIYSYLPQAAAVGIQDNILFYICPQGEILKIGTIKKHIKTQAATLITHRIGFSCLIIKKLK